MNWKSIGIIFRKELLDTLRDKKTLIFMVALPVLLVPGLSTVMARVSQSEMKKTRQRRLVVETQADERDRFCSFLRERLAVRRAETNAALDLYGPTVSEPVRAIAANLAIDPFEVLSGLASDPRVNAHARAGELRDALAMMQDQAIAQLRTLMADDGSGDASIHGPGGPALDVDQAHRAQSFLDLLSPLVTFDFVTEEEAAHRPKERDAAPVASLPASIRGDPRLCSAATAISERRIHALLRVPRALDAGVAARDDTVAIEVAIDSTIDLSAEAGRRIDSSIAAARQLALDERLTRESLPASFVAPVRVETRNAAPRSKEVLKFVASLLPYVLILMCFLGGIYPAMDLGAGEKERLTLETLLVAPSSRFEIALGKFGVVFLSSVIASLLATASLAYTFTSGIASKELSAAFELKLDAKTVALCIALIVPLAATFGSLMLALSIYAKSQKEAQSMMMPLQFLIIVPAMLSMIPSIELNTKFAWVPILNVALGLRTILTAGGAPLPWTEIAIIFLSTSLFALLALSWCARRFGQESVIFRS